MSRNRPSSLIARLAATERQDPLRCFAAPPGLPAGLEGVFPVTQALLDHAADPDDNGLLYLHDLVTAAADPDTLPADREALVDTIPTDHPGNLDHTLRGLPDFALRILPDRSVAARVRGPDGPLTLLWPRHCLDLAKAANDLNPTAQCRAFYNDGARLTWQALQRGLRRRDIDPRRPGQWPADLTVALWHVILDKLANHAFLSGRLDDRTPPPHTLRRQPVLDRQQALEPLSPDEPLTNLAAGIPDFTLGLEPDSGRIRLLVETTDDEALLFGRPLVPATDTLAFLWNPAELHGLARTRMRRPNAYHRIRQSLALPAALTVPC